MHKLLNLLLPFLFLTSYSQTLVNQRVLDTLPSPTNSYRYFKGVPDGSGGYIGLYNYYSTSGQRENFRLIRLASDGSILGSVDYNSLHNGSDFGTNLYVKNDYLYVCAITMDTPFIDSHVFNIMKIRISTFDTIWTISESIDSPVSQAPVSIVADDAGSVFVGGSVHTPTGRRMVALKYDSNGHRLWEAGYDTVGMNSAAVAMTLSGSALVVTGFSFDAIGHSNFVTWFMSRSTGGRIGLELVPTGTGAISHPVSIVTDAAGSSYIAGTSTVSGTASVIKVVKYDSLFHEVWQQTYGDSAQTNTAAAMVSDNFVNSDLYIAGTVPNASGGTDMVLIVYGSDGTLYGSRTISASDPTHATAARDIANDGQNTYLTGTMYSGTDTDIVTAGYDVNGDLMWEKIYKRAPGSNDIPYNIGVSDDGKTVYVTTRSEGADTIYALLSYEQYTKTNTLATTSGGGQYAANQLIVRFDRSAIKQDAVNNLDIDFGDPHYFLKDSAYDSLQAHVPFSLGDCKFERIYKGLKATYKYSQARNGDMIPIPDFWAAFLLIHPDLAEGDETGLGNSINPLFPMVVHTNLNYVGQLLNGCDPNPTYAINDPEFANQYNLTTDTCSRPADPFYGINIDSAWRLETGKAFVKVGIYDSGLQGNHADFSPGLSGTSGSKAYGWDFQSHTSMEANGWPNTNHHATSVAGFIGAIRNNMRGIAGIAGGDQGANATDVGVTLYGMKITDNNGDYSNTIPLSDICNAIAIGTMYLPAALYGYGLHVINNSWNLGTQPCQCRVLAPSDIAELELAFKNAYRNQATIVAAAGNTRAVGYPANFYNDWIICVGGVDKHGVHWYGGNNALNGYVESFPGACVDIAAPSSSDFSYPAYTTTGLVQTDHFFNGTSMAAPHATGTVALLMSYMDSTASSLKNLSPEDAEHLLTRSAMDVDTPGKDFNTGWGLLNAGGALREVNKACKELRHYRLDDTRVNGNIINRNLIPITPTERFINIDGKTYDTIPYLCYIIRQSDTIYHNLSSNYIIIDAWTRSSSTTMLGFYDTVTNKLQPFEHLYLDYYDQEKAVISGYFYQVFSGSDTTTPIGMWGNRDSLYISTDSLRFDYTLLIRDTTKLCDSLILSSISKIDSHIKVKLQPNPVDDKGELTIFTDNEHHSKIVLLDMQGREVQTIYDGHIRQGSSTFYLDTRKLSSGIYLINIDFGDEKQTIKFTKL